MSVSELYELFLESSGISIDTRNIEPKSLFFTLKGEHFDGNTFVFEALRKGALAVIADSRSVADDPRFQKNTDRIVFVSDALTMLQELALHHRKTFGAKPVIAITGSNGKTTTKELVAAVLQKKFRIVRTEGNLNNHIGVPLTLLRIRKSTEIAIIEMGANRPGDIHDLCCIAQPTHGVITNIGEAHLEGFGSKEGVAKTKGALYEWLRDHAGTIFINKNDRDLASLLYAVDPGYLAETIRYGDENVPENKAIFGKFNEENMRTAIAIGRYFKLTMGIMVKKLKNYAPNNMRSQILSTKKGNDVILDAYNANPSSMKAALESFAAFSSVKPKWLILGDMKELGTSSEAAHQNILNDLLFHCFTNVILIGQAFFEAHEKMKRFASFPTKEDFLASPFAASIKNSSVLIKGSNSMKMWEIADIL